MDVVTKGQSPIQIERYEQFFGFHEAPFSLAPNPRYLFESASHAAALAQLGYAMERREPLVVMTGEIGTGKTLLCRTVLQRVERKTFVSVINNPLLERDDLLKQILEDFGIISKDRTTATAASRHDLVHALEDFLTSLIPLQGHAVVIIDEAQHVQPDVLEQIRLLSNIDEAKGTMLQIILVGQSDLEALLSRPELRQLQQRVSRRIRLEPLSAAELPLYIRHRLALGRAARSNMPGADDLALAMAEWEGSGPGVTFTPDAIQAIWTFSSGLPRLVNLVCDRALETACARQLRTIDAAVIDSAALALGAPAQPQRLIPTAVAAVVPVEVDAPIDPVAPLPAIAASPGKSAPGRKSVGVIAGAVAVAAVAIWFFTRGPSPQGDTPPSARQSPPPVAAAPVAPPASAPSSESTTVPDPPAATAPRPQTTAAAAPAVGATGGDGRFDIVVASFRTEARATSVAAQVAVLGISVRQRVSSGWQQVVAGPFPSRAKAEEAHERLERAGLSDTHIVPVVR